MSWYHKALLPIKSFYLFASPETYYEWEFEGTIPEKTPIFYGDSKKAHSTKGIILSLNGDSSIAQKNGDQYFLNKKVPIQQASFISGLAKNKDDILNNLKESQDQFKNGLNRFIEAMKSRGYFISSKHKPSLFGVGIKNNKPVLYNYGLWENVLKKALATQKALSMAPRYEVFKARDLSDLHKLTNSLMELNYDIPIDKKKIDLIVKNAGIEIISSVEKDWNDFYVSLDPHGKAIKTKIDALSGLKWIKNFGRKF